jgi:hypothetical protein
VIPVLIIDESDVSAVVATLGTVLNWATWLAFVVEVIVMLAVSPSRGAWLRTHPLEVAVVVLTPPFLPAALGSLRLLRLLWLVRISLVSSPAAHSRCPENDKSPEGLGASSVPPRGFEPRFPP